MNHTNGHFSMVPYCSDDDGDDDWVHTHGRIWRLCTEDVMISGNTGIAS